jgi:hypothetical protein
MLGYGTYVFFVVFCLLPFVWTFVFVSEANGRTLEQLDHLFGDPAARLKRLGDVVRERGFSS